MGVYFTEKCLKVERVSQEKTSRAFTSLPCPKIDAMQPEGSEDGCHYQEVFEWMGAVACGIDMYVCVYVSDYDYMSKGVRKFLYFVKWLEIGMI